ncbi:MAG: hypothetical protein SGILL_007173, partial [Bacillariaceae sp.]
MTGHDFTQEETDIFAERLLNGIMKKTFDFPDGTKCQTFARGQWYADPLTKRLHVGRCVGFLDHGKFMWVLVKTNPAHQREAQEYILRIIVLVPGALKELNECRETKEGRRLFAQFLKKYLYQRFAKSEIGEFIKAEEFKNFWNIEFLKAYANAYSDLYIGFVEEGQSQLPSADAVVVQRLWDHEDRISKIVRYCDSFFDKTADELKKITKNNKKDKEVQAAMKKEMVTLWDTQQQQQQQLNSQQNQIDDLDQFVTERKEEVDEHIDHLYQGLTETKEDVGDLDQRFVEREKNVDERLTDMKEDYNQRLSVQDGIIKNLQDQVARLTGGVGGEAAPTHLKESEKVEGQERIDYERRFSDQDAVIKDLKDQLAKLSGGVGGKPALVVGDGEQAPVVGKKQVAQNVVVNWRDPLDPKLLEELRKWQLERKTNSTHRSGLAGSSFQMLQNGEWFITKLLNRQAAGKEKKARRGEFEFGNVAA